MAKRKRRTQSSKRKQKTPLPAQSQNEQRVVQLLEYEITSEPIYDRRYKKLPRHVKDAIERLHHEAQKRPRKVIPELLALLKKYPDIPMLYNYLSIAYSQSGQRKKSEEVVRENYRRNPDYLFARLNYAELYRLKGDYDKIAEIFEHKFDLKLLYPERKKFHISEVANFMGLIGIYFFETGERDMAERYFDILKDIAPEFLMTKMLRRKLHPGIIRRALNRVKGQT